MNAKVKIAALAKERDELKAENQRLRAVAGDTPGIAITRLAGLRVIVGDIVQRGLAMLDSGPRASLPEPARRVFGAWLGRSIELAANAHGGELDLNLLPSAGDPQPAPVDDPEGRSVWELVIADVSPTVRDSLGAQIVADMRARHEFGVKKYGQALKTGDRRDSLMDAYQEVLDGIVYTFKDMIERPGDPMAAADYRALLGLAASYRRRMAIRQMVAATMGDNPTPPATGMPQGE